PSSPVPCPLRERVVSPRRHPPPHRFERLRVDGRPADLHAQRRHQLRLHRISQQPDGATALGTAERGRERAVARELALLEQHLPVAFHTEKLHRHSHSEEWAQGCTALKGSAVPGTRFSVGTLTMRVPCFAPPHPTRRESGAMGSARVVARRTRERALRPRRPRTDRPPCSPPHRTARRRAPARTASPGAPRRATPPWGSSP